MADPGKKKLKLVDDFETASWRMEGWQKVDDDTVLHRRRIPVTGDRNGIMLQIFDFNTFQLTTIFDLKGYNTGELSGSMQVIPFSQIENKQALKDAHQALTDLKGNPPHIDIVLGVDVTLDKNVTVRGPIKLRGNEP
ncbi:MAG: hypothetical protein ACAH80_11370 [Alphaproteobacteria bacterium]